MTIFRYNQVVLALVLRYLFQGVHVVLKSAPGAFEKRRPRATFYQACTPPSIQLWVRPANCLDKKLIGVLLW